MSNIYKFEEVIENSLAELLDFKTILKNVFFDYNPLHSDKIYRSLRLS